MNRSLTMLAALPLALLLAGTPPPAGAQLPPPIQVTSCTILQAPPIDTRPFWNPFGFAPLPTGIPVTDGIQIAFINRSTIVADRVVFVVNYRGEIERIVDAGTFSPNVTIKHTFSNFSGLSYLGPRPNSCRPRIVRFVDGTIWRGP